MAQKLHFSRLLDIISGSALAGANTKVQKSALYKDFDIPCNFFILESYIR